MKSLRTVIAISVLTCACLSSSSTPPPSSYPEGVAKVVAQVKGITCPTCGAVAEVALRRRLPAVGAISISQSEQTVAVEFTHGGGVFSPAVFREAVDEAGIEVVNMQIDACGAVEETPNQQWFVAGANRFALDDGGRTPAGLSMCISGWLDDRSTPYRLVPTAIHAVSTETQSGTYP